MTATIWRTCPSCGSSFEQPDDPGRKRVYCSRACQQAAYRARQRTSAGQRHSSGGQRTGRQDRREHWRSERHEQRYQRPRSERPGAGQRHHQRQDWQEQYHQRRPPPGSANGQRPSATGGDDLARIQRIIAALLRKAVATSFPHEAAACREKAEALRVKYGL
jgi:predicted dehydrogenase